MSMISCAESDKGIWLAGTSYKVKTGKGIIGAFLKCSILFKLKEG